MNPDKVDIEKLGNYFVFFEIDKRFGITFEQFVDKVSKGVWHTFVEV